MTLPVGGPVRVITVPLTRDDGLTVPEMLEVPTWHAMEGARSARQRLRTLRTMNLHSLAPRRDNRNPAIAASSYSSVSTPQRLRFGIVISDGTFRREGILSSIQNIRRELRTDAAMIEFFDRCSASVAAFETPTAESNRPPSPLPPAFRAGTSVPDTTALPTLHPPALRPKGRPRPHASEGARPAPNGRRRPTDPRSQGVEFLVGLPRFGALDCVDGQDPPSQRQSLPPPFVWLLPSSVGP